MIIFDPIRGELVFAADPTNGGSGTPGASAYEIAVANGFVGTEAQWLASLHGLNGLNGVAGVRWFVGPGTPVIDPIYHDGDPVERDLYLQSGTGNVYQLTAYAGGDVFWVMVANIRGPAGTGGGGGGDAGYEVMSNGVLPDPEIVFDGVTGDVEYGFVG